MITCKNGSVHQHETVTQSKMCWGVISAPAPVFTPTPATAPVSTTKLPGISPYGITDSQFNYAVKILGGDEFRALRMNKSEASAYIKQLLRDKKRGTSVSTPSAPAPATRIPWTPTPKPPPDPRLMMVKGILDTGMVPDGYFATQSEDGAPVTFIRLSHPKRNKYAGSLKIQSQHGPRLETDAILWSSGNWSVNRSSIIDPMISLVTDFRSCAMRYSKLIGKCCRCNSPLTDDKSRHYGIGPICDQVWTWVIEMIDDQNDGKSFEQLTREPGYVAVSRRA